MIKKLFLLLIVILIINFLKIGNASAWDSWGSRGGYYFDLWNSRGNYYRDLRKFNWDIRRHHYWNLQNYYWHRKYDYYRGAPLFLFNLDRHRPTILFYKDSRRSRTCWIIPFGSVVFINCD